MAKKKSNLGTAAAAGVAGMAVGAAVGAAAVALSDEKKRKVVLKKANEMKAQAGKTVTKTMKDMQKKSMPLMKKAKTMVGSGKVNGSKTKSAAKTGSKSTTKTANATQ